MTVPCNDDSGEGSKLDGSIRQVVAKAVRTQL